MSLTVVKAGLQTTLQGAPFAGHRHLGMPAAGAADCLSLALSNRLVEKPVDALALEITLTEALFESAASGAMAVVGSAAFVRINGMDRPVHRRLTLSPGDRIHIGPSHPGARSYLALSAPLGASEILGGQSTYLAAGLGGFDGRALQAGDRIRFAADPSPLSEESVTPEPLRLHYSQDLVLRVVSGPEAKGTKCLDRLCAAPFRVGTRANRMGLALEGEPLETRPTADMPSAAVFPGTIQLPPAGQPYLLGPDAQTTGGYPRIAQVILADRHLIGQLAPGSRVRFVHITAERATEIYREKLSLLAPWLGAVRLW